jgi:hypothetical protein
LSITCPECAGIVDQAIASEAVVLFAATVNMPYLEHGVTVPCSVCGRTWNFSVATVSAEPQYIPEGAVLTDGDRNNAKELNDLEARAALEDPLSFAEAFDLFNESFDKWEKGNGS